MCTNKIGIVATRILFWLFFCSIQLNGQQNVALHFDGDNDYIELAPINQLSPNGNFKVEMWCFSEATNLVNPSFPCSGNFRILFSFGGPPPGNTFQIGECDGILSLLIIGPSGSSGILQLDSINVRDNNWHCISVERQSGTISVYYDGALVLNTSDNGLLVTYFRLGHWPGFPTPGQDWQGRIDDVKIWNTVPPSSTPSCSRCALDCNDPNLIAYWRFDEGIPGGNNTSITHVLDCTGKGNDGKFFIDTTLIPPTFALNGSTSNYVLSNSPLLYPHYMNSYIVVSPPNSPQTSMLAGICSGEPVHFSIFNVNNVPAQASVGTTVTWEYSDDCLSYLPISANPPLFSSFSFVSPPGHPATTLTSVPANACLNRCYRATINVTDGVTTCTYTVVHNSLQICHPIQNVQLAVSPSGPLCQGDLPTFSATLSSNMPPPGPSNSVTINWEVSLGGGPWIPLTGPGYSNQTNISYTPPGPLQPPNICFKATISNATCPSVTVQQCVAVDAKPVCGTITGAPSPPTLVADPLNPNHYFICPGNHAALQFATPFTNCIPVWQFEYPNTNPGVWHNMGSSNSTQNTGTLPWSGPIINPYAWPPGETCIRYRVVCNPLTSPSGCSPCTSNVVQVCLKTPPTPPVIAAVPQKFICKGGQSILFVQNPDPNCTYQWYHDGLPVGSGSTWIANQGGCYWVSCSDGCFTVTSSKVCLIVCEPVAVICCPTPTCPCDGQPITLSGQESNCSFGNCGPLTYSWSWTDVNGPQTATTPTITSIPFSTGTTYTLTVTDANGCSDTTQVTIVPCK
jgi:hypothetical protein